MSPSNHTLCRHPTTVRANTSRTRSNTCWHPHPKKELATESDGEIRRIPWEQLVNYRTVLSAGARPTAQWSPMQKRRASSNWMQVQTHFRPQSISEGLWALRDLENNYTCQACLCAQHAKSFHGNALKTAGDAFAAARDCSSRARRSLRRIFPDGTLGKESTNSMQLGRTAL